MKGCICESWIRGGGTRRTSYRECRVQERERCHYQFSRVGRVCPYSGTFTEKPVVLHIHITRAIHSTLSGCAVVASLLLWMFAFCLSACLSQSTCLSVSSDCSVSTRSVCVRVCVCISVCFRISTVCCRVFSYSRRIKCCNARIRFVKPLWLECFWESNVAM